MPETNKINKPQHVCGLQGYDPMKDPPCPACVISEPNDMTCAVCGGTFEFPEGADCYDHRVCRDSCHNPAKWKALAELEARVSKAEGEQLRIALDQPAVEANMKLLARIDELKEILSLKDKTIEAQFKSLKEMDTRLDWLELTLGVDKHAKATPH